MVFICYAALLQLAQYMRALVIAVGIPAGDLFQRAQAATAETDIFFYGTYRDTGRALFFFCIHINRLTRIINQGVIILSQKT